MGAHLCATTAKVTQSAKLLGSTFSSMLSPYPLSSCTHLTLGPAIQRTRPSAVRIALIIAVRLVHLGVCLLFPALGVKVLVEKI